ncbi:MAG TPA: OmpA family protein [Lentimicrobium sp.]|nr:OmpA family protein [Lentimicrobium sp.]
MMKPNFTINLRKSALFDLLISILVFCLCTITGIENSPAQGVLGRAIKEKVQQKMIEKTDEAIDDAVDNNEEAQENQDAEETQEEAAPENEQPETTVVKQKIETKSQYDFVPGDQVIFYEDFSQDAIGDFPALWTTSGSGEVKTVNVAPGHWLHMNATDQVYIPMKDLNLPENFILEFDLITQPREDDGHFSFYLSMYKSPDDFLNEDLYPGSNGVHVTISDDRWLVTGYQNEKDKMVDGESDIATVVNDELTHVIIWVQKARMRIYHKGQKVIDLPTIMYLPNDFNRLRFSLWSSGGHPLLSNIRITTAAPDTRSKLLTEGKLISYGIYFDVNSDKIKPESKGAVNDIAKVLNENPDVRIRIDGHTDSDGDNAKNLDLSKRRAASVKNMLVSEFSVDGSRIETDGFGETKPVADNSSSDGKAKNRRVEFIKL